MTSSITQLPAASNGIKSTTSTQRSRAGHGTATLRQREAQGLISLSCDALSQAHQAGDDIHAAIYDKDASITDAELQDQLADVLTCMETAEHYLLMLGSVIEDRPVREPGTSSV